MIRSRNQNSFLAVATLGVYLGLILAGAAPTVLAQAATAKQFSVKDEAGRKDDLDKNPDKCDASHLREKIVNYKTEFLWFNDLSVYEYTGLVRKVLDLYPDKVVDGIDVSWQSNGKSRPTRHVNTAVAYPYGFLDDDTQRLLDWDVKDFGNGFPGKSFSFSILRNAFGNEFRFESQQIPFDAPLVRSLYSSAIDFHKCENWSNERAILNNTELVVDKDHLVITTRLARGSLDTLLASNAK